MKLLRNMPLRKRRNIAAYLFLIPWLMGLVIFVARPLFQSIIFSFHRVRMFPTGMELEFVGLQNFRDVWFRDIFFITALITYILDTIIRVPIIVVIALILAILLNQKMRFQGFFRVIFFLPVIIASGPVINELAATGATSIPMLDVAAIQMFLATIFPDFIVEPVVGVFNQIILILWFTGVQILIFLAGLQKISPSLYEAAKIDGGSDWECFWKITLPTIKPIILINLVFTLVNLSNHSTNPIIDLIMDSMFSGTTDYGYASAMAWLYAIVVGFLLLVVFLFFIKREDKQTRKIRKKNKKEQKRYRKTRASIERNNRRLERQLQKKKLPVTNKEVG